MSAWDKYAICPGCDAKYRVPFGNTAHLHFEVCPRCGEGDARWNGRFGSGWEVKTLRFIGWRWLEHGVATPEEIEAAEQIQAASSRRGCLISLATVAAIIAAVLWGGLDFTL